jgi:hypothetical protein
VDGAATTDAAGMSSTADNAIGPVEMMLIGFPGDSFNGSIMPALGELTEQGMVRLIDLIVVTKDGEGNVTAVELDDLDDVQAAAFDDLEGEVGELFSDEDLLIAGERLEPNSTAALVLWENSWASKLSSAIFDAGGEVLMHDRIPAEIVAMAMESQGAS